MVLNAYFIRSSPKHNLYQMKKRSSKMSQNNPCEKMSTDWAIVYFRTKSLVFRLLSKWSIDNQWKEAKKTIERSIYTKTQLLGNFQQGDCLQSSCLIYQLIAIHKTGALLIFVCIPQKDDNSNSKIQGLFVLVTKYAHYYDILAITRRFPHEYIFVIAAYLTRISVVIFMIICVISPFLHIFAPIT